MENRGASKPTEEGLSDRKNRSTAITSAFAVAFSRVEIVVVVVVVVVGRYHRLALGLPYSSSSTDQTTRGNTTQLRDRLEYKRCRFWSTLGGQGDVGRGETVGRRRRRRRFAARGFACVA